MKASFSVLDQPWIPVVSLSGEEKKLGIRQTLVQAHEMREISSSSPLEEYSIYRFLGLFLMDALRPETETDIEDLLESGHFNGEQIELYIRLCESEGVSFDLFDADRPFLQCKYDSAYDKEIKPVSVLDCALPSGNNHTHFGHRRDVPKSLTADEALRLVLVTYLFCTAAAQGYPSGVYGAPPYFGVIKGKNLFETLSWNLLQTDLIGIEFDTPPVLWRSSDPVIPKREIGKTSWTRGMLFPTRRIHLVPDEDSSVNGVYLCQGENYVNKEGWRDPYVTYRRNKETVFPLRPSADRALWRNFCDIINIPGQLASQLLRQYRSIKDEGNIELTLYGVETSQASYLGIYRQSLSFPAQLLNDEENLEVLRLCISASETVAGALGKGVSGIESLSESESRLCVSRYYQRCEKRFWSFIATFPDPSNRKEKYAGFCDDIGADAITSFADVLRGVTLRGTALASAEKQRSVLYKCISKLKKEARI